MSDPTLATALAAALYDHDYQNHKAEAEALAAHPAVVAWADGLRAEAAVQGATDEYREALRRRRLVHDAGCRCWPHISASPALWEDALASPEEPR